MRTLRSFLDDLKKTDNLINIDDEVNWDLQAAAICGMNQRVGGPAVHFTNVSGYPGASLAGSLFTGPGYSYENEVNRKMQTKIAVGLGLEPDIHYEELMEVLGERLSSPIRGIEVDSGSVEEVVKEGDEVNLWEYPFPRIHDKDAGRYLTSHVVMTRDAETGWTNWGVYRFLVTGRNELVMGTLPHLQRSRDAQMIAKKYAEKGEPLPFAVVIGVAPALFFTAAMLSPPGVDELGIAGGLMLDPVATIKAKLSDIAIPAEAEMVLEGHIYPGDTKDEGPFGWVSYYTPKQQSLVYRVERISHRKNPIIPFVAEGMMPSDTVCIYSVFHSRQLMDNLTANKCTVRYVALPVEARLTLGIAAMEVKVPGMAQRIANNLIGGSPFVRKAVVVDADIDGEDLCPALNDMAQKSHPLRDVHVHPRVDKTLGWTENHDWDTGLTSTVWWDAAWPYGKEENEPETLPMRGEFEIIYPKELQEEVIRKWNDVLKLEPKAWRFKWADE